MKNENLVAALKDVTVDELAAAERIIDAHLTVAYLRYRSIPTRENKNALDWVDEDKEIIREALSQVKEGAPTLANR